MTEQTNADKHSKDISYHAKAKLSLVGVAKEVVRMQGYISIDKL